MGVRFHFKHINIILKANTALGTDPDTPGITAYQMTESLQSIALCVIPPPEIIDRCCLV